MNPSRPSPPLTLELVASSPGRRTRPSARQPDVPDPQVIDIAVQADDRLLLTVEEAARRLSIGRTLCYELVAAGQIRTIRVGRLRRVPVDALRDFVLGMDAGPDPAA